MELDVVTRIALFGFLAAMIFGAVANKTQFCIMGSISDWINMGSKVRFRAWMLALGIAILGTQAMQLAGWIDLSRAIYLTTNFGWLGYVLGGFIFGIGMTLGAGCGQRTLVRVGGGNLKSLVVLLVLAFTAYMTLRGLFAVVRIELINVTDVDLSLSEFPNQSIGAFLSSWSGADMALLNKVIALVIVITTFVYAFGDKFFRASRDNILAGITLGLFIVSAWYITGVLGNDDFEPVPLEGVSFISPVGNTMNYLMTWTGSTINFSIAVVFGVITGSFIYAILSRTFRIESFTTRQDLINHLVAGVLMGFGGVLSLGCTIGQGVTGSSTLALGSFMALVSIIFGSALTMKVQYYMLDDGFWFSLHQSFADMHLLPKPANS